MNNNNNLTNKLSTDTNSNSTIFSSFNNNVHHIY